MMKSAPIFEHYEVISGPAFVHLRGYGRMYRYQGNVTSMTRDRHITLRPEGTAPVVRSYVEDELLPEGTKTK